MSKEPEENKTKLSRANFYKFFKKNFSKDVNFLEKTRKTYLNYIIAILVIAIAVGVGYLKVINMSTYDAIAPIFITTLGIAAILLILIIKSYKYKAKKLVLNKLLAFIGDIKYIEKNEYAVDDRIYIDSLNLFDYYNRYSCDDRLKGTYNNLPIDIMEIELKKETGTGKNRRVEKIFKGIFIKVPCNKKFKTKTIIKEDTIKIGDNKNRVKLEDPEFEKIYDVYSSDQVEARYLITTAFMNRMVELRKKNNKIILSFEQGNVNIALSTNSDWFELSIFKPANDINQYREILEQIMTIFSILDSLKLDQNIGL